MTASTSGSWLIAGLLCVGALGTTVRAQAQAQVRDKAAAEALFDEGRKLMAAGNFASACSKLEASQALDAGVGTQLNLADCYEKLGKTASAWAESRETITAAHHAGSVERERIAKQRADALEPQLSYLTILAPREPSLNVTRDATRIDTAAIGSALPVDPGTYVIAAVAHGKQRWSTTITVGPAADRVSVSVPSLHAEPEQVAKPEPVALEPQPAATQLSAADSSTSRPTATNAQKLIGMIAAGSGVAALAVAGYFGAQAAGRWSDAKANCDPYPYCGETGQRLAHDAQSSGTISTVAFIAGGALLAGGVVLWLSAPGPARDTETALLLGPASVQLRGSFQ